MWKRALTSSPRISVPDDGYGNSGYRVSEILYNEQRAIVHLVIVNRFGDEVFRWDSQQDVQTVVPSTKRAKLIRSITDTANKLYYKEGINQEQLRKFVNFYTRVIEKDGWNGEFRFDDLFARWMEKKIA